MYRWLSDMWETAFLRKIASQHGFTVPNPNVPFAQVLITNIAIVVFSHLLTFSDNAFYLLLPYLLIFSVMSVPFSLNIQ